MKSGVLRTKKNNPYKGGNMYAPLFLKINYNSTKFEVGTVRKKRVEC